MPVAAPSGMHYAIESNGVAFGILIPDQASELAGAIRIRITSENDWVLKVAAPPQFLVSQEGETVPIGRMSWRSALSGVFVPFHEGQHVVVARGPATVAGPRLVTLDLRMLLQENDPVGQYECSLRIFLEPL